VYLGECRKPVQPIYADVSYSTKSYDLKPGKETWVGTQDLVGSRYVSGFSWSAFSENTKVTWTEITIKDPSIVTPVDALKKVRVG